MKRILFVLVLFLPVISFAQQIANVDAYQSGNKIIIEYSIAGNGTDDMFSVVPSFSTDGGNRFTVLKSVSGDLNNVSAGDKRRIEWRVTEDYESFVHSSVVFKVDLKSVQSGSVQSGSAQSLPAQSVSSQSSGEEYYRKGLECEKAKKYADAIKYYREASKRGHNKAEERIKLLQLHFW